MGAPRTTSLTNTGNTDTSMTTKDSTDPTDGTPSVQDFAQFNLAPALLTAVQELGYQQPTPIQAQSIPAIMQGRDVMGAAQTGTGKTAAFVLPILHRLLPYASHSMSPARHPVRALILTPTRELADQVGQSVKDYSKFTPLRSAVVFGGVDMGSQTEVLQQGCEVLVATPGRLLDHMGQRHLSLAQVSILVLDEADRMLDMGFLPDLSRIVQALPKKRQGLLFSATFSSEIRRLSRQFLQQPIEIEVAVRNIAAETVTQRVLEVATADKQAALLQLLTDKKWPQSIVFTNTRAGAGQVARYLARHGVQAEAIHGDKSQNERLRILASFKDEQTPVLVATDVAARGLDIAGVAGVVNLELPFNAEDYVHRIGRTGRAGAEGEAYSLVDRRQERRQLDDIEQLIGEAIPKGAALSLPQSEAPAPSRADASDRSRGPRGRSGRQTTGRGRGQTGRARHQSADPIFSQPYEPEAPPAKKTVSRPAPASDRDERPAVGLLLGDPSPKQEK